VSGYTARNPLMPPEAPSWLPPEDAAVLERLRSPAALNPLLGPDPYGGAAIGTSTTAPQAQAVDANGQPFDPVVGRGLPVTRGQLAGIARDAWQTAGAVSDGGIAAPGMMGAIKAYHGSPHDFGRFDMSKIGTGEGAQAYGHGLYFAGNEGVARGYRDKLSGSYAQINGKTLWRNNQMVGNPSTADTLILAHGGDVDAAIKEFSERVSDWSPVQRQRIGADDTLKALEQSRGNVTVRAAGSPGKMYEVNLDVEPHQLLDWDKPLAGQSPQVQEGMLRVFKARVPDDVVQLPTGRWAPTSEGVVMGRATGWPDRETAQYAAKTLRENAMAPLGLKGSDAYLNAVSEHGLLREGAAVPAAASLRDAGIPGIQYLDAGSRSAGTGTSNFVMFDDGLIQILRKYGLPGVVTGGAAAAAAPGQGDTP